jgi:hypothetical protein
VNIMMRELVWCIYFGQPRYDLNETVKADSRLNTVLHARTGRWHLLRRRSLPGPQ